MDEPIRWKRPRQQHADLRDDWVGLVRRAMAEGTAHDPTEHGIGYVRGYRQGVWDAMRLTLSEGEANAIVAEAGKGTGR